MLRWSRWFVALVSLSMATAGCGAATIRETVDRELRSNAPSGMTYSDGELRKARRFAPEAIADLDAAGQAPTQGPAMNAYACVANYVNAVMFREGFLGKVTEDELFGYTKVRTPGTLVQEATSAADRCLSTCTSAGSAAGARWLPKCKALHADLTASSARHAQDEAVAEVQKQVDGASATAAEGRWITFFVHVVQARKLVTEAKSKLPNEPRIDELRGRLEQLAARHDDKRRLVETFERDPQVLALEARRSRLWDDRTLAAMAVEDDQRAIEDASPQTTYRAGVVTAQRAGDPVALERAQRRAELHRRRLAEIDADLRDIDALVARRASQLGL